MVNVRPLAGVHDIRALDDQRLPILGLRLHELQELLDTLEWHPSDLLEVLGPRRCLQRGTLTLLIVTGRRTIGPFGQTGCRICDASCRHVWQRLVATILASR